MFIKRLALFIFMALGLPALQVSAADSRPNYEMRGMTTTLWDMDVDYFARPIVLTRTSATNGVHWVEFNVNYYQKYCAFWDQQCVATDSQGRCTRWERVCRQWDYHVSQIGKRIELNFRRATPLAQGEQETYELTVHRSKPFDEGEDSVSTWLKGDKVLKPVVVRKWGTYQYDVEAK